LEALATFMQTYRIAVLPGDGIGPEVMAAALHVLRGTGLRFDFTAHDFGADHFRRTGIALPQRVVDDCLAADAVLFGAIGLPDVRLPDNTEVQPIMMVGLRRVLDLYAAVRPIKLYPGLPTPLKDVGKGIDFIILRENLEGLFASFGGGCLVGDELASDSLIITRKGTERIVDYAFHLAKRRTGRPLDGKRLVTCVDKANIFRSYAFFRKIFFEVAAKHPGIATEAFYVDAASMYLVQNPQAFDVLVMENQFGDILSDLGAGLVGGLGMAPSAEIGPKHGLFQPSHGTAPTIAGKDVANPLAMILSTGMMLDWLGAKHNDPDAAAAGQRIEQAVANVIREGKTLSPDLGGRSGTREVGEAVQRMMQEPT
jgi:3-isopropylmalate dehydrogenase